MASFIKNAIILYSLTIYVSTTWTPEFLPYSSDRTFQAKIQKQPFELNQQTVKSAECRIDSTVCRAPSNNPNNTDFFYNGVLRTGYLNVDEKPGSALGFMFFGRRDTDQQNLKNYPTIVSLGGGPGMSSQFSSFRQVGPLSLKKIFSPIITLNNFTWARDANLLFIDQPIGTGISCSADSNHIPTKIQNVAVDFLRAFNKLFTSDEKLKIDGCFSEKNLNIPASSSFFIFGQGYAGKYASAIAQKILAEKNAGRSTIGLKGIGIGGGLNNPFKTLSQIGNYGFSMSLLDYQQRMRVEKMLLRASFNYENKDWLGLRTDFERALSYIYQRTGVSYYDIKKDGFDEDLVQNYFTNRSNLIRFVYESSINFQTLSQQVYNKLAADFMTNQIASLQSLLRSSLPVLVYQGQDDAYANPTGTMRWVDELNFPYSVQFREQNLRAWRVNGALYGSMKNSGSLTYMVVHNAGHYVGQDNPEAAYYMARDWIAGNNK